MKTILARNWRRLLIAAGLGLTLASLIGVAQSGIAANIGVMIVAGLGVVVATISSMLVLYTDGSLFRRLSAALFALLGITLVFVGFASMLALFGLFWSDLYSVSGRMIPFFAALAPWAWFGVVLMLTDRFQIRAIGDDDIWVEKMVVAGVVPTAIASCFFLLVSRQPLLLSLVGLISGAVIYIALACFSHITRRIKRQRVARAWGDRRKRRVPARFSTGFWQDVGCKRLGFGQWARKGAFCLQS